MKWLRFIVFGWLGLPIGFLGLILCCTIILKPIGDLLIKFGDWLIGGYLS